jgi:phosphoribosylamine--glycine ligase
MQRHHIPTASYASFTAKQYDQAIDYVNAHSLPIVLKADGLAAGKGVIICQTHEEARRELNAMLNDKAFGAASETVVIEQFLKGIEVSVFVLTDGESYVLLPDAKDYKRIFDNDEGPNTGGMGAVSPVPFFKDSFRDKVITKIIEPSIQGLKKEGIPYQGFIFFGLINVDGEPYVIEYNSRMGDPETEAVLFRLQDDLYPYFEAVQHKKLHSMAPLKFKEQTAVTVMATAQGYPGNYEKNMTFNESPTPPTTFALHAGTKAKGNEIVTSGGRVFAITALANSIEEARNEAYETIRLFSFEQMYYRRDIGMDMILLEQNANQTAH